MHWSGYRTCLLPQTPCRPVGTDNTNSGRTYIGLIDTGGVGRYATSRVANYDYNQSRTLHLCRHAVPGNRKDAPPNPTENPALRSLAAHRDSPRNLADDLRRIFCFVPPMRYGRGADAARQPRQSRAGAACCRHLRGLLRSGIRRSSRSSRSATALHATTARCRTGACCR